jgi:hypothetical protein
MSTKKSINDEPDLIQREVWRAKDALSREFGNDLRRLADYLKSAEAEERQRRAKTSPGRVS